MTDVVDDFVSLFDGRRDAVGTEEGGVLRACEADIHASACFDHLHGNEKPIGVYPLVPNAYIDLDGPPKGVLDWRVKWGCVDLDVKGPSHVTGYDTHADAYIKAQVLRDALRICDITGFVEVTRSGGYHVWVFSECWVSAASMRRMLLVMCEIANIPPTEVNPKSEGFDDPDTLGNYVRLPYPGWLARTNLADRLAANRIVLDKDGEPIGVHTFLADAMESLTPTPLIEKYAAMYKPEPQVSVEFGDAEGWDQVKRKLSGLAYVIATEDLLEGQDRSSRLWKLAKMCKDDGLTPAEAVVVVTQADILHGQKFVGRSDGERRIQSTVRRAYQEGTK